MSRLTKFTLFCVAIILLGFWWFYFHQSQSEKIIPENENFHTSMYYYDNSDFFTQSVKSFANVKPVSPAPHIFIVNQHILAAHIIAGQFALSADPKVKTVVLITQNNWNAGRAPIITSSFGWKTPLGVIEPATAIADS